jgi:hypothetical protein
VLRINDLPLHTTFDGRTFEFQLGVSLYDEVRCCGRLGGQFVGRFVGRAVRRLGGWGHARVAPTRAWGLCLVGEDLRGLRDLGWSASWFGGARDTSACRSDSLSVGRIGVSKEASPHAVGSAAQWSTADPRGQSTAMANRRTCPSTAVVQAYGTFYGNTVYSMSDAYDRNRAAQRNAIDLDFSFDVYYHTAVSDPRCMVRGPPARARCG